MDKIDSEEIEAKKLNLKTENNISYFYCQAGINRNKFIKLLLELLYLRKNSK